MGKFSGGDMDMKKSKSHLFFVKYLFLIVCVIAVCALSFTALNNHHKHTTKIMENQKFQ